MFNWRLLSSDLCREHASDGKARLSLCRSIEFDTRYDLPLINLTPTPLTVGGPYLRPKQVRAWLWTNRHLRAMSRPWSMLVTNYDPVERVSTLHIATITLPEVMERYTRMQRNRPPTFTPLVF